MVLFAFFTDYLLPLMPVYQGDRLLATICGGVVGGIGDALIYMNNSSTGGLDFITMGIKARHPHLAVRQHHVCGGAGGHPAQRCGVPGC